MADYVGGGLSSDLSVYDTEYRGDDGTTPTEAVVEALAVVEDTDPLDLAPLAGAIDGDALNRLVTSGAPVVVQFTVEGCNVFVSGDGRIRVCDPDAPVDCAPVFERPIDE